jgi:predicted HTH transcriptional regulator
MNFDIEHIDTLAESCYLETKSAKGGLPDSLWETYSAFANTDGGTILLGVEENKEHHFVITGLKDAEKMKTDFWNAVNNRQKISHNILTNHMVYTVQKDGKDLLVIEVPRAERTARPVFKGLDPRIGTYRRWHEGDHLCALEEVGAMLRDATLTSQDAKVLKGMTWDVFCKDTIKAYRNHFRSINPDHPWNHLDDELFMRRIGATGVGDDGCYYPTSAGLLMFGYEYEITREFPQYFLDYRENSQLLGDVRWTDRIVSSSGDWSGNLFDFVRKILVKLEEGLKVPFVLRGFQRIDDTPLHKLLREATVNTLSHADFYGRQGVVIRKDATGFVFSNPGRLRIPKQEAIDGGVSDPRNGVILKIFSLIRYGERAGSGLSNILDVWRKVYHAEPSICEKEGEVDRTILTLPYDGHEQDVQAMLKLYPSSDVVMEEETADKMGDKLPINDKIADKQAIKSTAGNKIADKQAIKSKIGDKIANKQATYSSAGDKQAINSTVLDNLTEIIYQLQSIKEAKVEDIIDCIGRSKSRVRWYLQFLIDLGLIQAHGANKNRTYSLATE